MNHTQFASSGRISRPRRSRLAAGFALLLVLAGTGATRAHGPDPRMGGAPWAPNQALRYQWRAGQAPPAWMGPAIDAAASDAGLSRASRAPTYARVTSGTASLIAYGEPTGCSPAGIACFSRAGAPSSFQMWFRAHGYVFDWGSLRWCQAQATPSDGCFDVENVALDEFGHVDVLGHHVNLAGNSDYRDAIVQAVARAKPAAGWQAHVFGPCDTARLQLEYDRQSPRDLFSSCLAIPTKLVLSASSTSLPTGGGLTMTASLRTTTTTANRALSNDPVSGRNVTLRRRIPGTQTWYSAGLLVSSGSVEGSYALTINPSTTYEWQAVFIPSSGDGAVSATSAVVTVTVSGCASVTCGQAPVMTAAESTWRTRS